MKGIHFTEGKDILLDLLYPKRCPLCNQIRPYQQAAACPECMEKLRKIEAPRCLKCGKTIDSEDEEYCMDCQAIPKSYQRGYPVFEYTEAIKNALYDFKYKNQRDYAVFFADCMYRYYGVQLKKLMIDGLVPVPVHARKKRARGYNQAELLAGELAVRLQVPVYPHYLIRRENTSPQKDLNQAARMKNLKNAFKIGRNKIKLRRILLVDDIYTSGATIEACTRTLLLSGAEEVYYTSVAIGQGY